MGDICSTNGGDEKLIQIFGLKTFRTETSYDTSA